MYAHERTIRAPHAYMQHCAHVQMLVRVLACMLMLHMHYHVYTHACSLRL